jgi:hypothetical protein
MKFWLALIILCFTSAAWAEDRPSLLLYFGQQITQDAQVGVPPIYSVWLSRIDNAKKAAHQALAPYFRSIEECEGANVGDLIAKVKPKLAYGPVGGVFVARVEMEFYLGDGLRLGTLKAVGQQYGYIDSVYAEDSASKAFDKAMQSIAEQYVADTRLQESIRAGLATGLKRAPCAMVGLMPSR